MIQKNNRAGVCKPVYQLVVSITHTSYQLLEAISSEFGGRILKVKPRKIIPPHQPIPKKTAYAWKLSSIKAGNFLRRMQPWLIVKQEQCALALRFQEMIVSLRGYPGHNQTEEQFLEKERLRQAMRSLNN